MIGRISTEAACAVTGTPFERVSQYLKRGQLKLMLDTANPRPKTREWVVLDVVQLAVLRELTDVGVAISTASEFVNHETGSLGIAWGELSRATILEPGAAQWYMVVSRGPGCSGPGIEACNSLATARDIVFPSFPDDELFKPRVAVVLDLTSIARDVRRKLEAIGTA